MLNYLKAQQNPKVKADIVKCVDDHIQELIANTIEAYEDSGRPQNPPFGTGLIWDPHEQAILVKIGIARRNNKSFSEIADMLSQEGLTDRRGESFTSYQVRHYFNSVANEDVLRKVVLETGKA